MFIKPDIVETKGIWEIGISFAEILFPSFLTRINDFDSFFEGAKGIEGVIELSTKISFSLTLDLFDSCFFRLDVLILEIWSFVVRILS